MSFDSNVETIANVTSTDVQHSTINKENVQVSSEISHDSTNKVSLNIGNDRLNQLLDNLSTTQAQFDDYTQRRTQQISRETKYIIQRILDETKVKQRELLLEAQAKAQQFQDDYQNQLQIKVDEFNQQKAQQLADLEKNLYLEQETILANARQIIDQLQTEANQVYFHSFLCFQINFFIELIFLEKIECSSRSSKCNKCSSRTNY